MLSAFLDIATIGLAAILAGVASISVHRYRDRRIAFAAMGLACLGVVGFVGLLDQVWGYGGPYGALGIFPTVVLLLAEAFLYLSMVVPRTAQLAAAPAHPAT